MSPEFWALAEKFISTDSSQGNLAMLPLLREALAPLPARVREQPFAHGDKQHANLLASFGPEGGGLLLITHSDTVPPGPPERWTEGPAHALTRSEDRVVGLGVADVKLDYLCKVFALRALHESGELARLKKPLHLLATGAEEVGLVGAKLFAAGFKPEMALAGEPCELIPCHAHKGYAVVRVGLRVKDPQRLSRGRVLKSLGKAAHSSTPHLGENAILKMLAAAPLAELQGGSSANTVPAEASAIVAGDDPIDAIDLSSAAATMRELWSLWCAQTAALQPARDEEFAPAEAVNNLGRIESKDDVLQALFDARLLPEHDPAALIASFTAAARVPAALAFEAFTERDNPGMRAKPDSRLLAALTRASGKAPRAKPTSTEAGVFFRLGVDAAVMGPGVSIGNAHTANEWNSIRDLQNAVPIYTQLIRELCLA